VFRVLHPQLVMSSSDLSPFQLWRGADDGAYKAEKIAFKAASEYMAGNGLAPTQDEWEGVAALRERANELFSLAIQDMKATSHALWRLRS
jgi:hypothetical protein